MKKCPYCAEDIQDEARICRWCGKKVTGIWIRRIFKSFIVIALIAIGVLCWNLFQKNKDNLQQAVQDFKQVVVRFQETGMSMDEAMEKIEEYKGQMEYDTARKAHEK